MDVSVIVPFYRGNQYMEQLFATVGKNAANAPHAQIELLIVNDSPDCPVEYREDWVRGFSLRIVDNPENLGIHGSRVAGIRYARGKYLQLLDQDDRLADTAIASQLTAIGTCQAVVANGVDQARAGRIYRSLSHQTWATRERFYYSVSNMIVSPGQCLLRADAVPAFWLEQIMERNGSDDLLLWLLMFQQEVTWAVNPECLYTHVITGQNVSANGAKMMASSWEVLDLLEKTGRLTDRQRRRFRRSRGLGQRLVGKGRAGRLLAMLLYPDVLWEKLLRRML